MIPRSTAIREPYPTQSLENQFQAQNKVGLGWLRFTCPVEYRTYWTKRIKEFFSVTLHNRDRGWNGYQFSATGAYSIYVGWTPRFTQAERELLQIKHSPNEGYMTVDIPQDALDSLSDRNLIQLWIDVYACDGLKFTRVDLYYDDYCKVVSPEQLSHWLKRGGVGLARTQNIRSWDNYNHQTGTNDGFTLYLGSRKSGKMVRFYDKNAESKGKQNCYRWELELTGEYAKQFTDSFLNHVESAWKHDAVADIVTGIENGYKSYIKGAASFHDIEPGKSPQELGRNWVKRSPVCWWWEELLQGLEPAKIVLDRKTPSLRGTVNWVRSQVAPAFSLLVEAFRYWGIPSYAWIDTLLADGSERWSERHYKLFDEAMLTSPAY